MLANLAFETSKISTEKRPSLSCRGGILEEHGPYLPSFNDGYFSAYYAKRVAEAIAATRGGTVLMFPMIPLGTGLPEDFGGKAPFSGSYTVRPETLRAVYMDLASAIGEDGFRTLFVFNTHGAPTHNRALLEAAEYFNDRFDGRMVVLTSLLYSGDGQRPEILDAEERQEDGFAVHAGAEESSATLFLQPRLVHKDISEAPPYTAETAGELTGIAEQPDWPGYFGSPRLATAKKGTRSMEFKAAQLVEFALLVLDGDDWRDLSTRADLERLPPGFTVLDNNTRQRAATERLRQAEWLESQGLNDN